jgi:uncharacterized protein YgiM (DUF1202 family)
MIAGVSPETILKIMIPIIVVILLVAVIKFVTNKHSSGDAQTTEAAVTESVQETMQVVTAAPIPVETTQAQTEPETTQEAEAVYKYTTTDSLKVRTAPGTDAGVIDVLQPGTEVTYIEQTDDKWSKISYNGSEAYVATEYLKKEQVQ